MFGLTKKVDYGLLLLLSLAEHGGAVVPLSKIAKKKRMPLSFLSQVAVSLKKAGVIDSREGKGGGYFLKKDPAEIRITEVIEFLEGPLSLTSCSAGEPCQSENCCTVREPLLAIENKLNDILNSYTVSDLVS